jgi:hypothetical protein
MKNNNNNNRSLQPVNYSEMQKMINNYKQQHHSDPDFLASEYFDVEAIRALISNPKCKGIRVYNAIKDDNGEKQNRLIIMAEDENNKTLLTFNAGLSAVSVASLGASIGFIETVVGIVENGMPCPPMCQ